MPISKPLITVIVPVYNVEKYISRCIESILVQSYENLDIVLIDDGSTDQSGSICDEYAQRDSRIRVIHQKNQGLSSARNAGLDVAKGSYIGFIDGDDYVEKSMYETLIASMSASDARIGGCGFYYVDEAEMKLGESRRIATGLYSKEEAFARLGDNSAFVIMWNKLFAEELFHNIRFPVGMQHEDEFVVHRLYDKVDSVAFIDDKLYNYLQRSDSIMGLKRAEKRLDVIAAFEDRCCFFMENGYRHLAAETFYRAQTVSQLILDELGSKTEEERSARQRALWSLERMKKGLPLSRRVIWKIKGAIRSILALVNRER